MKKRLKIKIEDNMFAEQIIGIIRCIVYKRNKIVGYQEHENHSVTIETSDFKGTLAKAEDYLLHTEEEKELME